MRVLCVTWILCLLGTSAVTAQEQALEGRTVRLWSPELPGGRITALVQASTPDSLVLLGSGRDDLHARPTRAADLLTVSVPSISRLDVEVLRTRQAMIRREAVFGGLSGVVIGGLVGYGFVELGAERSSIAVLVPATAVTGALLGAGWGAIAPLGRGWKRVRLPG